MVMRKEGQVGVGEGSGNVAMPKTHHRAALVAVKGYVCETR